MTTIKSHRNASAFTLVEILVVLVILSIMGSMVVTATQGVTRVARESRTRSIISICDSVVQEIYEDTKYRSFAVEVPNLFSPQAGTDSDSGHTRIGYEVLANESARVRLHMLRDLQRQLLPDRLSDLSSPPITIFAACNLIGENSSGDIVSVRGRNDSRQSFSVVWSGDPKRFTMANRLAGADVENQGAECLYAIMATTYIGGLPAIALIPASNIGDTEATPDGALEILDGWGNPLAFIRWPVGYDDAVDAIDVTIADEFDLYRSDFAYVPGVNASADVNGVPQAIDVNSGAELRPWALRPLIVSSGEDETFGIALNPYSQGSDLSGEGDSLFSYTDESLRWQRDSSHMGDELPGRGADAAIDSNPNNDYVFPDPYLRAFVRENDPSDLTGQSSGRRLLGQRLQIGDDVVIDNITNFDGEQ